MASVYDVAQYILAKYGTLDAMKLQKLVYYSQAWHAVRADAPLFGEPVKAYEKGPVVGRLFYKHKGRRWVTPEVVEYGDPEALTYEQSCLVDAVIDHYGQMSPEELSDLTHEEQPWKDARAWSEWDSVITRECMRDFYAAQLVERPSASPKLPTMAVTFVSSHDLECVLTSADEPDDVSLFLRSLTRARSTIGA